MTVIALFFGIAILLLALGQTPSVPTPTGAITGATTGGIAPAPAPGTITGVQQTIQGVTFRVDAHDFLAPGTTIDVEGGVQRADGSIPLDTGTLPATTTLNPSERVIVFAWGDGQTTNIAGTSSKLPFGRLSILPKFGIFTAGCISFLLSKIESII